MTATANVTEDSVRTVFITVFCIEAASPPKRFAVFSETNLVKAMGKEKAATRVKIVEKNVRIDKAPMSAWVSALVFVTVT